ncbi:MAG: hypothetical protein JWN34_2061 [Bryobacterales bacterium]|nr:hypothetical protein [Bryobacterales bacterium]
MKVISVLMVLVGLVLGIGAALEFQYFGPSSTQFWVGVFTTPASLFFVAAGIALWLRGTAVLGVVLTASVAMAAATVAATFLRVMGPPATILGLAGAGIAFCWARREHRSCGLG